jgi:hypothetical protein
VTTRAVQPTEGKTLRVLDEDGNETDYETDFVPRIGERILLEYRTAKGGPSKQHYFRVKDVMYRLQNKPSSQAAILVEEETDGRYWLSE